MSNAITDDEMARLQTAVGQPCSRILLAHLAGADEEFVAAKADGIYRDAECLILEFDRQQVTFTWTQDSLGDPCRIWCPSPAGWYEPGSLKMQDVSSIFPWSSYVGEVLSWFTVHTSLFSDDPSQNDREYRHVAWGIELGFLDQSLLAATLHDDLLVAHTPYGVAGLIARFG
jgi:hypothetical protein